MPASKCYGDVHTDSATTPIISWDASTRRDVTSLEVKIAVGILAAPAALARFSERRIMVPAYTNAFCCTRYPLWIDFPRLDRTFKMPPAGGSKTYCVSPVTARWPSGGVRGCDSTSATTCQCHSLHK